MRQHTIILIVGIYLCAQACIDPLEVRIPVYRAQLVVDAAVYEGNETQRVKLFMSAPLNGREEFQNPLPVSNADVRIVVNNSNEVVLNEIGPGNYESNSAELMGVAGNSYQLLITTADGTQYASDVQLMQAAGEIRDLYYEFVPQHSYNSRTGLYEDAFYVYLDAQADAQSNGLLRWRYEGIYENQTNPELHFFVIGTPAGPIRVPDPLPCSGYSAQVDSTTNPAAILQTPNGPIYRVGDCSCCECWVYENNGRVNLARNQFVSDKTFSKVLIAIVPVDRWRFQKRYAIDVTQLSITESVYDFWKLVESQQQGANSLFQPNIVIINGNIKNLSNPDDQVLGVFSASARTSKQLFIERSAVPYNLNAPPVFWNDCRTQFSRSTTEKPLFW